MSSGARWGSVVRWGRGMVLHRWQGATVVGPEVLDVGGTLPVALPLRGAPRPDPARRSTLNPAIAWVVHRAEGTIVGMDDELLPVAVLTTDDGVEVVGVTERADGSLVRRDGEPLDLVSIVVVLGLEPLAA